MKLWWDIWQSSLPCSGGLSMVYSSSLSNDCWDHRNGFFKIKEHYIWIQTACIKKNGHCHSSSTAYSYTIPIPSCIYRHTQNVSITRTIGWKYLVQGDQNLLYVWTGLPWWDWASFVHKSTWQKNVFAVNYSLSPSRRFCFDWCMSGCHAWLYTDMTMLLALGGAL